MSRVECAGEKVLTFSICRSGISLRIQFHQFGLSVGHSPLNRDLKSVLIPNNPVSGEVLRLTNLGICSFFVLMPEFSPISIFESAIPSTITVGALGVSAGFPSPAGDDLEDEIDPISWVVRRPGSTFWYRAEGDCLVSDSRHKYKRLCHVNASFQTLR